MWRDVVNDLTRLQVLPVKAVLFFVYGGQYTLVPFFGVIFKSFGFDIQSVSVLYAIQPIAAFIASIVSSCLTRPSRIKLVVCVLLLLSLFFNNLLLLLSPKPSPLLLRFHIATTDTNFTLKLVAPPERCNVTYSRSILHLNFENCDKTPVLSNSSAMSLPLPKDHFSLDIVGNDLTLEQHLHSSPSLSFVYNETLYNELNFEADTTCDIFSPVDKASCEKDIGRLLHTLILVALATACSSLVIILIESAVVTAARLNNSEIGLQRIWSFFGATVWPLFAALLVEKTESLHSLFYLYDGLMLAGLCVVVVMNVTLDYEPLSWRAFRRTAGHLEEVFRVAPMFFAVIVLGATWGFMDAFLFWYMEELSSGVIWMALSVSLGSLGTVLFCLSSSRLRMLGEGWSALVLASAVYCTRFVGYYVGNSVFVCVGVAVLEPLTNANLMLALSRFCESDPGKGRRRRIFNVAAWSSLHVISGRIIGAPVGAYGIASYGSSLTFRYWAYPLAALAVTVALIKASRSIFLSREKDTGREGQTVADGPSGRSQTKLPSSAPTVFGALSLAAVTRTWMADVISASSESWPTSSTGPIISCPDDEKFDEDSFQKDLLALRQSRLHTYAPNVFSRSASMPAVPSRYSVTAISRQRMSLPPVLEEPSANKPEGRLKTRLAAPKPGLTKTDATQDKDDKGESTRF
ncbi:uncharacterized protein LOC135394962 [Ornithodoros turicata]|uniref:uncharacterized protein LOC135394962 n=1 Tax=Ornithodoros turicata TaxID=34597 RepID=UPI003139C3D4